jgi:hypothetical protein
MSYSLRYYSGTCMGGLRKTMKNLSHNDQSLGRDLDPGRPEYEAGVLTIQSQRSEWNVFNTRQPRGSG